MPIEGGSIDTGSRAGAFAQGGSALQRKRRAPCLDTGSSSNVSVKSEGQRRRRFGETGGGDDQVSGVRAGVRAAQGGAGQEHQVAWLGKGPRWNLTDACAAKEDVNRGEVDKELKGMVRTKSVKTRAYIEQLEARIEKYDGMFRSGMAQAIKGKMGVPPCVGVESYRGFLEWVHLGRAGEECAKADGRELWILGEMYEVGGLREWLLEKGIGMGSLVGAVEFGVMPEGINRDGILSRCLDVVEEGGWVVDDGVLRGASREAIKGLALGAGKRGVGKRLGWLYVRDGFRLLEGWLEANGGALNGGNYAVFRDVEGGLDLLSMPFQALRETIGKWRVVDAVWVDGLYERKQAVGGVFLAEYKVERRYDLEKGVNAAVIALHGSGSQQRMAVIDIQNVCVDIVDVESGELIVNAGSYGERPGQFLYPFAVAFSSAGELYVSDCNGHHVPEDEDSYDGYRISVFDRQGRYVRRIGKFGARNGEFNAPTGICFTADGNLVVADQYNNRVQIVGEDGAFVRKFGSRGKRKGQFDRPFDVSVGPDCSIAVLDNSHRLQIFDGEGRFLRCFGSKGKGPGQFRDPCQVSHGAGGEIIVSDRGRNDVQVFSREGELLHSIGAEGDSKVAWQGELWGVAVDCEGRIAVSVVRRDDETVQQKREVVLLSH